MSQLARDGGGEGIDSVFPSLPLTREVSRLARDEGREKSGKHTAESSDLCEAILRREFGFTGIIMTDWVVGNGLMNSKQDIHPAVKPQLVAAAGGDVFMPGCKADMRNILKGLANGEVTRKQLQINATRMYRMAKELCDK